MLIDSIDALEHFLKRAKNSDYVALDTEFLRVNQYYPKLCLLQLSTDDVSVCLDMLALKDNQALIDFLYRDDLLWIAHSARQDIEILFQLSKRLPKRIFDTQIGAYFAGYVHQISYKNLVADVCHKNLDKTHTRFNWTIRPLPKKALNYALEDVIYLRAIYDKLYQNLNNKGLLDWCQEDTNNQLLLKSYYEVEVENAWQKVKIPHKNINQTVFSQIVCLACYRELKAQKEDKPRQWVFDDHQLIYYAHHPNKFPDIKALETTIKNYPKLLQIPYVEQKHKALSDAQKKEKLCWQKLVSEKADAYNLNPEIIANTKQINALVQNRKNSLNHGWRAKLLNIGEKTNE